MFSQLMIIYMYLCERQNQDVQIVHIFVSDKQVEQYSSSI